jgi:hypothetical protein
VLKTVSSNTSPADGTFSDVVLTYTAQAGDSGALGITIGTTNAGSGRSTDFDNVRLNYFYHTPAEQWRLLHFGSILDRGNGMYHFDADQDGLNNLIERAAGTDPNDASSYSMPSTSFSDINGDPGSDYITLSYRRLAGGTSSAGNDYTAQGITYTLQHSADLSLPWLDSDWVAVSTSPAVDGVESATFRLDLPLSRFNRNFFRLSVTQD